MKVRSKHCQCLRTEVRAMHARKDSRKCQHVQFKLGIISFHIHASMHVMPYIALVLLLITVIIAVLMNSLCLDLPAWLSLPSQFPCLCDRLLYLSQRHSLRISIRFASSNFSPFVWECHWLFYLWFSMAIELIIESR